MVNGEATAGNLVWFNKFELCPSENSVLPCLHKAQTVGFAGLMGCEEGFVSETSVE